MPFLEFYELLGSTFCDEKFENAQRSLIFSIIHQLLLCFILFVFRRVNLHLVESQFLFLIFDALLGLWVGAIDNGKSQVQEEEGTDEDERDEEKEDYWGVGLLIHDHNLWPALQCDALEHVEKGPEDVVKVGHVVVRIECGLATVVAYWARLTPADDLLAF